FGFAENTDDLFVGKTLLHGDVLMWLMKTLLTSGCTNQRGAGQLLNCLYLAAELWDWLEKHLSVFKALARILV
ncbi:hypothetical protein KVN01_23985, partial [Enterobacter hormaechei]|nr:hypothetical protein [Enterobacter hormaechei]MCV3621255.1 hypothetical protein [Enterobacter hormaechei]MCV3649283.1 hypothetical protein [Enterobacter hormaechei]